MYQPRPGPDRSVRQGAARSRPGWVLGRVGGTPVMLAPSWLLIAAVIVALYFPVVRRVAPFASTTAVVLTTLAVVVMLFVSVLVHELAHGLTATRFGAPPREYVITFWGGHTAFDRELPTAGSSALVSVAGPAANAVLAALAWLALRAVPPDVTAFLVVYGAFFTNALVAAFNLLPGLPLDGGRVLESLVWAVTGDRVRGMTVAAWAGRVVVVGGVLGAALYYAVRGMQPGLTTVVWVALLGSFLWSGAGQTLRAAQVQRSAQGLDLLALATPALALPAVARLADLPAALAGREGSAVVLVEQGRPVALLDPAAVRQVPPENYAATPLTAVARGLAPEQAVDALRGADALAAVARAQRHGPVVVLLVDGGVLGVVEVARVARQVQRFGAR
ncbi:peptidase M50 [Georgenia yuyongxinii]|uniref:Peptidase M50 n=1 Tax=Georgenia yuyongxinii TaxID=2589797 RepID=A0A5B8C4X4_9MICO|nr:site-2 protease family protein [Georgenia yuyongxinii]QDC24471.1 peptidase M50 [Georgenia yuyongxinii]